MVKFSRIALAVVAPALLLAILLVGVNAQSAFPTTSILDDFNRENESPATGWDHLDGWFGVVDNAAANTQEASAFFSVYSESFQSNQEAYVTISDGIASSMEFGPIARFNSDGDGYIVNYNDGVIALFRMDDWNPTLLEYTTTIEISPGDSLGIRCLDTTISVWYMESGESWEQVLSDVDVSYSSGGIGLWASPNDPDPVIFDDFGGGSYQEPTPTPTPQSMPNMIAYNSVATITLSSGQIVSVNYTYTFGDMAVTALLSMLVIVMGANLVYTITVKVWELRRPR